MKNGYVLMIIFGLYNLVDWGLYNAAQGKPGNHQLEFHGIENMGLVKLETSDSESVFLQTNEPVLRT